jgi:hypothetical protein
MGKDRDKLLSHVAYQTELMSEINRCRLVFLDAMVREGIITDEQKVAMSAYILQLVNKHVVGTSTWSLFGEASGKIDDNGTYFEVVKLTSVPDYVDDIIDVLNEQIDVPERLPKNRKPVVKKSGNKIIPFKDYHKPDTVKDGKNDEDQSG